MGKKYWLMKTEPDVYSIDHLARDKKTYWDGVRNYQARNFIRDEMQPGDKVFFYHSNAEPPGIAGVAAVASKGYPDPSAFDSKDVHYDSKSKKDNPAWYVVDIRFVKKFKQLISLEELKKIKGLQQMALFTTARLSVQPVRENEWEIINAYNLQ